ncbi:hypothetical protein MD484_g1975, partial [Candolleomyces efflorescens]
MPFASGDENAGASSASAKPRTKRFSRILRNSNTDSDSSAREPWITAGDPLTPSAPNGGPDEWSARRGTIDPFASSPESKSFFIDLSDSSTTTSDAKRDSFLSMTTTASNSSPAISLFQFPRKERPISIQTMPLPPRSRCSSFQCRGQGKRDSWVLAEEDADIFFPNGDALAEEFEEGDDAAAQIDWRQFHIDLLTVEEV